MVASDSTLRTASPRGSSRSSGTAGAASVGKVESRVLRLLVQKATAAWRGPDLERAPEAPPQPAAEATAPSDIEAFEAHLSGLAGDNAGLLAGSLQHVGLDEVRDALGDAWPALAPQLLSFAATRLQLWTGLHDEVRRHGGTGFVVRLANLPQPAADQQAKRLALRLKAELLENFPQVASGNRPPPATAAGPAHEIMARRLEASERYRHAVQRHDGADPRLWRSALGQAVIELLEADGELSAEALIAQLQSLECDELVLCAASVDAAIERLRLLVARMATAEAKSEVTAESDTGAA